MNEAKFRLGYVVSHPIQYQAPLFRRLAMEPELDLEVLFLSDFSVRRYEDPGFGAPVQWDVPLLEGYRYRVLEHRDPGPVAGFFWPRTRGMARALREGRYDAVWFHGYSQWSNLQGVYWCRNAGVPYFVRTEMWRLTASRPKLFGPLKEAMVRAIVRNSAGCLYVGEHNRRYYKSLGVRDDRLFFVPYSVNNEFFAQLADEARAKREALLKTYGLAEGATKILFASKLQKRKRVLDLFEACSRLWNQHGTRAFELVVVGTGEDEQELRRRVVEGGLTDRVKMLGFRDQRQMAEIMGLCDVFVLPSDREPWGLVVNEAMAAGLPVVVTDEVGCAPDLVRPNENGFVVPVGDVDALANALGKLVASEPLRGAMSKRSREIVDEYSYEADVRGILQAIRSVKGVGKR